MKGRSRRITIRLAEGKTAPTVLLLGRMFIWKGSKPTYWKMGLWGLGGETDSGAFAARDDVRELFCRQLLMIIYALLFRKICGWNTVVDSAEWSELCRVKQCGHDHRGFQLSRTPRLRVEIALSYIRWGIYPLACIVGARFRDAILLRHSAQISTHNVLQPHHACAFKTKASKCCENISWAVMPNRL